GGQTRVWKYDALKRKLYERIPEQSATINDGTGTMWSSAWTYTSSNAVSTHQDARGVITSNGYDTINRLTSVSYNTTNAPGVAPTNNITYTFDNSNTSSTKGLLLSISLTGPLPTYTETYQFDSINRVSSRTISQDNKNYTVTYQYDNGGNTTQLIYPSGRVVNVNVDGAGRVSSITDPASVNYISGITYNAAGKVTGDMLGNGIAESYGYDSN